MSAHYTKRLSPEKLIDGWVLHARASHIMCDTQSGADGAGRRPYEIGIIQIVLLKTYLHCRAR